MLGNYFSTIVCVSTIDLFHFLVCKEATLLFHIAFGNLFTHCLMNVFHQVRACHFWFHLLVFLRLLSFFLFVWFPRFLFSRCCCFCIRFPIWILSSLGVFSFFRGAPLGWHQKVNSSPQGSWANKIFHGQNAGNHQRRCRDAVKQQNSFKKKLRKCSESWYMGFQSIIICKDRSIHMAVGTTE